jgi:hypothetical protein
VARRTASSTATDATSIAPGPVAGPSLRGETQFRRKGPLRWRSRSRVTRRGGAHPLSRPCRQRTNRENARDGRFGCSPTRCACHASSSTDGSDRPRPPAVVLLSGAVAVAVDAASVSEALVGLTLSARGVLTPTKVELRLGNALGTSTVSALARAMVVKVLVLTCATRLSASAMRPCNVCRPTKVPLISIAPPGPTLNPGLRRPPKTACSRPGGTPNAGATRSPMSGPNPPLSTPLAITAGASTTALRTPVGSPALTASMTP